MPYRRSGGNRQAMMRASHSCGGSVSSPTQSGVKIRRTGINAAFKPPHPRSVSWIAVKQTRDKKKANSMLTKLNKRRGGFTLVEMMIVVAIIALLAAIAVPGFLRARNRSQATRIIYDLRSLASAVRHSAIE